jgi:type I restriction enzyme S subunit
LRKDAVGIIFELQEMVWRVERLFALADQLELQLAKARGQVEKLTPSLLAKAFRGQLVPQDPTDEPAGKLLERVRTAAGATLKK